MAENKLFVIEEPENDIHPKALKALLELILKKSESNQFIITTHSNIVTRYLGSAKEAKIHSVSIEYNKDKIPTSKVQEIPKTPEARRELLENLGYEFNDVDLWEAWLFLEESSAEKIIRDYIIRWFTPSLQGKLRTFSARTKDEISIKLEDFNRLFCFLNLQPTYKNRVWVVVDGGENEKKIIEDLKIKYKVSDWEENKFRQFKEHDFERYYPSKFKDKVEDVLSAKKSERQQRKKELLSEVETWIKEDDEQAKAEFQSSAAEVILILKEIEQQLNKPKPYKPEPNSHPA